MLHIWKLLFFTPFLLYSCYSDIKTHRVTNNLWLIMFIFIFLIGLAAYNIMKMGIRIDNPWYIFIGYKTKISQLVNKHVRLLQDLNIVDRDVELHYRRGELDDRIIHELKNLSEKGLIKDEVWVTPKLPFMIPMTMGFYVAVFYGDLASELTKYLIFIFLKIKP